MAQSKKHLESLQVFRGLAAMAVVAHHTFSFLPRLKVEFLHWWLEFGQLGVDFFFVLSGYLMVTVHRRDFGKPESTPRYFLKRFSRIYPMVFVLCTVKISFLVLQGTSLSEKVHFYKLVSSFLLFPMPQTGDYFIEPLWTLSHELLFYGLFALPLLYGKKVGAVAASAWTLAIVGMNAVKFSAPDAAFPLQFILRPCNIAFLIGCATAFIPATNVEPLKRWGLAAISFGALLLNVFVLRSSLLLDGHQGPMELAYRISWALTFALVLFSAIAFEKNSQLKFPRLFVFLGDASYSIYLFHTSAIIVAGKILCRKLPVGPVWVGIVGILVLIALGVLSGVVAYLVVEKPLTKRLQKWINRSA